ncbi:MAG: Ig-like domain-containing protein [Candidatus Methylomirabilales bacterium]
MNKKLWLFAGAGVALIFLTLAMTRGKGTSTTRPVVRGQRVAAITPPQVEMAPFPVSQPREWKILHHWPRDGQMEQPRRSVIKVFFNRPTDPEVVEGAFEITPHVPGTFEWSTADRLVFTPTEPLLPDTEYTVLLESARGSRGGEEYILPGESWSFTTGSARTYRKDIKPLIAAHCYNCHGPNGEAATVRLRTYRNVRRYVVPGRSSESRFYTFLREQGHYINMAGANHSTREKRALIKDWIDEDGAAE